MQTRKEQNHRLRRQEVRRDSFSLGKTFFLKNNHVHSVSLGTMYDKHPKSRASKRYNHLKGFQRKMFELKTVTGDDVLLELHQSTSPHVIRKYTTNPSLLQPTTPITPIAVATSTTPTVATSPSSNSSSSSGLEVSTPSAKRRKSHTINDRNTCRKCFVHYGSATDNEYNSLWVKCAARRCDYWVHVFCLGLVVKQENERKFNETVKYFCTVHNPKTVPRKSSLLMKGGKHR